MSVQAELRTLEIDIPSQPESLVKLSLLLAEEEINLAAVSSLIESDMALAAAVLKAVNSSLYGLKGRVQSVVMRARNTDVTLPAGNFAASGNGKSLISTMNGQQIENAAAGQTSAATR